MMIIVEILIEFSRRMLSVAEGVVLPCSIDRHTCHIVSNNLPDLSKLRLELDMVVKEVG
jgi:hypothetical protein